MTAVKWRRRRLPTPARARPGAIRRRPAWYLIVLAAIGVVAAVLGILQIGSPTSSARTAKEIVTAERGVAQSTVTGSGDVEPAVEDSVGFQASGTLEHLYVKQGDHVVSGQLLATLDPTSAQDTVNQAEQELTAAKDSLSAAETDSSSASTTDSRTAVNRSDDSRFVSYSPTTTTSTTTTAAGTTTTSGTTSTAPSTTASPTTPSRSTSTTPATTTVTVTAPSTTTTPSSRTAGERSGSGSAESAPSSASESTGSGSGSSSGGSSAQTTTTNPDTLAANIASAQAQVDSAEATLKSAETALSETKLYAPASGTVVNVEDVSPGDVVSASSTSSTSSSSAGDSSSDSSGSSAGGTTSGSLSGSSDSSTSTSTSSTGLVEIVNARRMTITVPFDESDISKLKVGQPATVTFNALTGVELAAKVSTISTIPTTSDSVVSYDATLTLTQRNAQVKPGMTASVAVIDQQASGVTLPNSAVPGAGNTADVNVTANGKTTPTEVIVGVRGDSRTQIVKGLRAGQQVVVTETLPSTDTASSSGSNSSTGTLGGAAGAGGFGGGGFGGGGFGGGGGRFGGG
jgi:membrane fusion protein, macrolide-specific efflux system